MRQAMYRKRLDANKETFWENIYETDDISTTVFTDTKLDPNTTYRYTITAINHTGLESPPSPPLSITTPKQLLRPKVKGLYAEVDRENKHIQLSWRYNDPDILEIQIFRKEANGDFLRYATLPKESKSFKDKKATPNTTYSYGIQVIFRNGDASDWNDTLIIY